MAASQIQSELILHSNKERHNAIPKEILGSAEALKY